MTRGTRDRRLAALALLSMAGAGCGGGGAPGEPFIVEVVAPTGDDPENPTPVFLNSVDELEILFVPQDREGQQFEDVSMRTFADGEVTSRVTTTGQYQIRLSRAWVVDHATPEDGAFTLQIPFFYDGGKPDPEIRAPTLRATVLRGSDPPERIAESRPAPPVPWPLPEGGMQPLELVCNSGSETQCRNLD